MSGVVCGSSVMCHVEMRCRWFLIDKHCIHILEKTLCIHVVTVWWTLLCVLSWFFCWLIIPLLYFLSNPSQPIHLVLLTLLWLLSPLHSGAGESTAAPDSGQCGGDSHHHPPGAGPSLCATNFPSYHVPPPHVCLSLPQQLPKPHHAQSLAG